MPSNYSNSNIKAQKDIDTPMRRSHKNAPKKGPPKEGLRAGLNTSCLLSLQADGQFFSATIPPLAEAQPSLVLRQEILREMWASRSAHNLLTQSCSCCCGSEGQ